MIWQLVVIEKKKKKQLYYYMSIYIYCMSNLAIDDQKSVFDW